jgi:hypothetical protein
MTAATVTNTLDLHIPGIEVVQLTVTDGETYVSKNFAKVTHAIATCNEDNDGEVNVVTSGAQTVTINAAGMTDKKITVVLFGQLGN